MTFGMCSECYGSNLQITICYECAASICKDCKDKCCD